MTTALKVSAAYGTGTPQLKPGETVVVQWGEFNRVDPLLTESRRAAIVQSYTAAGMPLEGIVTLRSLGFTQEEQEQLVRGDYVTGITQ